MLISFEEINRILLCNNINITGAFQIGAHNCEELPFYHKLGIKNTDIIWIDAIPSKVSKAINNGIPNVYNAVIMDKDDIEVVFNISNNGQSSSLLEFGTHLQEHPDIKFIDTIKQKSITIDSFFTRQNIVASKYNFWNLHIQGAELMALRGAVQSIIFAKAIHIKVNEKELYINCGLIGDIDRFLYKYNFKRVLTNMTIHGWGDALYIIDK